MEGSQQTGENVEETSQETSPEGVEGAQDGSGTSSEPTPSSAQGGQAQGAGVDPQTGGQTEFRHNRLQGRSPAEIERYVQQLEDTVREQGTALTAQQRQQQQQPQRRQQQGQPQDGPPEIGEDEFFSKPGESVRKILEYELRNTVQPLNEQVQQLAQRDQADRLRQRYRNKFPEWDRHEGQIELMAQRSGLSLEQVLANEQVTEVMYYAAKGMASGEGTQPMSQQNQNQNQQGQQSPAQQQQPRQAPQEGVPQHRPSAAPLPNQRQGHQSGPSRELTENERRLAREYGMTAQEFLDWQAMEVEEVVGGQRPEGS